MKHFLPALFASILLSISSIGQNINFDKTNAREGEDVEYCVTHKKRSVYEQSAAYLKLRAAAQKIMQEKEAEIKAARLAGNKQAGVVYTIPVVFHVLHNGGAENISRAQILDAMEVLNRDFRLQNIDAANVATPFQGMPSDVEIEFALATVAPNGACFGGITRTQSALTDDGSDGSAQLMAALGGNDVYQSTSSNAWSPNKYLNILVANEIGGAAGYTFNPWGSSQLYTNSIFMLHEYVGRIGTGTLGRDRALTHEVGHWLNLSHTWGGNNNPGNTSSCNSDDGVSDTPNTIGVTTCYINESTCGPQANVENYMDYSYCSKMFTQGQVDRMRAAAQAYRSSMYSASNLAAVGATGGTACKAIFSTPRTTVCVGETIQLTDESYNNIVTWNWTATGGALSSAIEQNPTVIYNSPGTYSISLTVNDGSNSVSENKTNYITVLPNPGNAMPVYEGFEDATSLPNSNWYVDNPDGSYAWNVSSAAASTGSKSARLYNYGNQEGDEDELISTSYDLSNMASVTMTFKYAFAKKSDANTDKLQVLASYNCGSSWGVRKTLSSSQMPTAINTSGSFIPTELEWNEATVTNISGSYLTDNFRFMFKFFSGGGNNVYIDDINIWGVDNQGNNVGSPNMTGMNEIFANTSMMLYPNPTKGNTTLSLDLGDRTEEISIELFDMVGKKMHTIYNGELASGSHTYTIGTQELSKGVYLVVVNSKGQISTKKLMVE